MCEGTCTYGAAAAIASLIMDLSGRCSSVTRRQNVVVASR
jgi:hypothetical protein